MKNNNIFLFTNKNALAKLKSKLENIFLGLLILLATNHLLASNHNETISNGPITNAVAPCPGIPVAASPQIICQWDAVEVLKATVDAGATLKWYTTETGGTPLDSFDTLVPGNYYAAAANADGSCESTRKLVVVATNNALYFDGVNDYVTLAKNPFVNKQKVFTIEAWIKPDETNYNKAFHNIIGSVQANGYDGYRGPSLYMADNVQGTGPGGLHFDSYSAISTKRFAFWTYPTDTPLIAKNVWSHVAIVNDGTNYTLYVNGKQVKLLVDGKAADTAPAPPLGVNIVATNIYTLGRVDNYYAGLIDEARFWNVARTSAEIAGNMEVNLKGNESGLVSYYSFDQGIANGDNTGMDNMVPADPLFDSTATQNTGLIRNFALTGTASNFVGGYFAQILSPSSVTVVGGTIQLTHTAPGGTWSSSSDATAKVDALGLVTGVSGGSAVISYSLCGLSTTYAITVLPNEKPTISKIEDKSTCPGTNVPTLAFTLGDDTTPLNSLVVTASSSNTALIPDSNIILGGTGANRTITLTTAAGQKGTATITIKATDGNGVSSTMAFIVSYTDTTAPVADIASLPAINEQCSVTSLTAPKATDLCAGKITGTTKTPLPITSSTKIIWEYTDGTNSSTQEQIVTIADTTAPVPDNASLPAINEQCSVTSLTAPKATDLCAGKITGTTKTPLPITSSTKIIWEYTDGTNSSTQEQIVTIADTTAPVPDNASLPTINEQCSVTSLTAPKATDLCAGKITGTTKATLPITSSTKIIWEFTDGTNSSTQEQIVTIADTAAPVANATTLPIIKGMCSVTSLTAPTATDLCAGVVTGTTKTTLPITSSTKIIWEYTDGKNKSTQEQIVTIENIITPITKNIELDLDSSGHATITASQIDNGSNDSCGGPVTLEASRLDFNCETVGAIPVTLTVKDQHGNTASGTAIVTVKGFGCTLKVSQAITPNGDGINDTWFIYNIENYPNTTIRVFNRWGAQVFFSDNYKNDWDGRYKNSNDNLPASGNYYYQIDVNSDGTIENSGWLYITK